jgi:hypothetical protein
LKYDTNHSKKEPIRYIVSTSKVWWLERKQNNWMLVVK